jgi:hypothetical protein
MDRDQAYPLDILSSAQDSIPRLMDLIESLLPPEVR